MAVVARGTTVSFRLVEKFDQLPLEDASKIIYGELIPACEAEGVGLSFYGNHASRDSLHTVEEYDHLKAEHKLFDIERIQRAFASLHLIVQATTQYKMNSYALKYVVEKHSSQDDKYIYHGDLIVAMLLKGYCARFGKRTEEISVHCQFKTQVV